MPRDTIKRRGMTQGNTMKLRGAFWEGPKKLQQWITKCILATRQLRPSSQSLPPTFMERELIYRASSRSIYICKPLALDFRLFCVRVVYIAPTFAHLFRFHGHFSATRTFYSLYFKETINLSFYFNQFHHCHNLYKYFTQSFDDVE